MISDFDRDHVGEILRGLGDWFSADLLRLIAKADTVNRLKLSTVFPEHVGAYLAWWTNTEDYRKGMATAQSDAIEWKDLN